MEENQQQDPIQKNVPPATRPVLLTILCILTFIWSFMQFISCVFIPLHGETMILFASKMPAMKGMLNEQSMMMFRAGWSYYLPLFGLTALSFTGALLMWNLKKIGFHFYAIANIFVYCLPGFLLDVPFNITVLVFPGIFIALYAINLKFMK